MNEQLSRMERYAQDRQKSKRKSRREAAIETYTSNDSELKEEPLHVPASDLDNKEIKIEELPPRKELYPSQRLKLTRWFFNSLLYIFIVIMGLLLWWAVKDSPWGKTQGF
ncbi:hypothetical protein D3C80_1012550 [compost metagenome]